MLFVFFSTVLCGCDFVFDTKEPKTYSGIVLFENAPLEGVKIKDKINTYATTDKEGKFSFVSKSASIEIFAEKLGYSFSPKKQVLSTSTTNIVFTAKKASPLSGTLTLEAINIKPTSAISLPSNNFVFKHNNKDCIKIYGLSVFLNSNQIVERTNSNIYCPIDETTNILNYNDEYTLNLENGIADFKLTYILKTYYSYDRNQAVVTESSKIFSVNTTYYDSHLDENNCIEVYAFGINSISSGYSYDISFIFKYRQA